MSTQVKRNFPATQKLAATNTRAFRSFLLVAQFEAREIGARIRQARDEQGMTQEELAALASFSKRSLQTYEAGQTIPYKHLREIGRLLGKPSEWFLYGDEANGNGTATPPLPTGVDLETALTILTAEVTRLATAQEQMSALLVELAEEALPARRVPARRRQAG